MSRTNWLVFVAAFLWASGWILLSPLYGTSRLCFGIIAFVFSGIALLCLFSDMKSVWGHSGPAKSRLTLDAVIRVGMTLTCLLIGSWIATPIYQALNSRVHRMPALTMTVSRILQFVGADAACASGRAAFNTQEHIVPFSVTLELLDTYWVILFVIAVAIVIVPTLGRKWRLLGITLVGACCYSVLRVPFLLTVYTNYPDFTVMQFPQRAALFYDPLWRVLSFLPLAAILPLVTSQKLSFDQTRILSRSLRIRWRNVILVGSSLMFAGVAYTGVYTYQDPGTKKAARILMDDWHSGKWEPAEIKLGESDFGGVPLYAYSEVVRFLRSYYDRVDINSSGPLSAAQLDRYDVLILKTPAKPFDEREHIAIQDFVKKGGGLFLIADHSDLLGMNTYFNELISSWGARYNFDAVNGLATGWFYEYTPGMFCRHVAMQGIDKFEFLTSCSIRCPFFGNEMVIPGTDVISDPADYSQRNFFGKMFLSPEHAFGCFTLCAAKQIDKGRILLFTDGTIFSTFCFYRGGHPQFALNSVEWLNRKNYWGYLPNYAFGAIAIAAAIVGVVALWRMPSVITLAIGLSAFWLGCATGAIAFNAINETAYRPAAQRTKNHQVGFCTKGTYFRLPPVIGVDDPDPATSFNTFWLSTLRIGAEPKLIEDVQWIKREAPDVLVFINLYQHLERDDSDVLVQYVKNGGHLLVVDGIRNNSAGTNHLLAEFDMEIDFTSMKISGGQKIGSIGDAALHTVEKRIGKGTVVVAVDSIAVSDQSLGNAMAMPDQEKKKRYQDVFDLYRRCLAKPD